MHPLWWSSGVLNPMGYIILSTHIFLWTYSLNYTTNNTYHLNLLSLYAWVMSIVDKKLLKIPYFPFYDNYVWKKKEDNLQSNDIDSHLWDFAMIWSYPTLWWCIFIYISFFAKTRFKNNNIVNTKIWAKNIKLFNLIYSLLRVDFPYIFKFHIKHQVVLGSSFTIAFRFENNILYLKAI